MEDEIGKQIPSEKDPLIERTLESLGNETIDVNTEGMIMGEDHFNQRFDEPEMNFSIQNENDGEIEASQVESLYTEPLGLIQPDIGHPFFLAPGEDSSYKSTFLEVIFQTFSAKSYHFLLHVLIVILNTLSTFSYLLDGLRCLCGWDASGLVIFNFLIMPFYYLSFHVNFIGGYWVIINFAFLISNWMIITTANILHAISFRDNAMMLILYIFYGITSTIHYFILFLVQIQNTRAGVRGRRGREKGPPDEVPRYRYRVQFMEENVFAFLLGLVGYTPALLVIFVFFLEGKRVYVTDAFVHWIYVVYFFKFFVRRDFGYISTLCFGIYAICSINSFVSASVTINSAKTSLIWTNVSTMVSVLMNYVVVWSLLLQNMVNNYKRVRLQNRMYKLLSGKVVAAGWGDPKFTEEDQRLFRAARERNPRLTIQDYTIDSVVLFRPILPEFGNVGFERMLSSSDWFARDKTRKLPPETLLRYLEGDPYNQQQQISKKDE